jgi:hypothetical protein
MCDECCVVSLFFAFRFGTYIHTLPSSFPPLQSIRPLPTTYHSLDMSFRSLSPCLSGIRYIHLTRLPFSVCLAFLYIGSCVVLFL